MAKIKMKIANERMDFHVREMQKMTVFYAISYTEKTAIVIERKADGSTYHISNCTHKWQEGDFSKVPTLTGASFYAEFVAASNHLYQILRENSGIFPVNDVADPNYAK